MRSNLKKYYSTVSFPYFITACFANVHLYILPLLGPFGRMGPIGITFHLPQPRWYRELQKQPQCSPKLQKRLQWFRRLQWPSRWYRESQKLPQCSCKSRRRLWWFRDAVIVTTIISQIATWSQWIKIVIAHLTIANEIYIDVQIHMVSRTMCVDIDFKIYMDCRDE